MDPWVSLANELMPAAARLWGRAKLMRGQALDVPMLSAKLYGRAWSNFRAFCLLQNNHFSVESQIVLRSCVEATICLANLAKRGEAFVDDLRSDAAATLRGAQGILRSMGAEEDARVIEEHNRNIFGARREDGARHATLNMEALATEADAPHLYRTYRRISGLTAHVTGASITAFQIDQDNEPAARERHRQQQVRASRIALVDAIATLIQAMMNHAVIVGDDENLAVASAFSTTFQALSAKHLDELLDEGSV